MIRADIPWNELNLAYEVNKLQPSNKGSITLNEDKTEVVTDSDKEMLKLFHPQEAFEKNLRAYMSTVTPALKCRTDVQCTDGKGMLLKYAASYVTKWHDAFDGDAMYSKHVGPYEAAYRHLRNLRPLEPEMALSLTSKKFSWSKSRTKNITVPTRDSQKPKSYDKYLKRSQEEESSSFKQWLRKYVDSKEKPTQYKQGSTLVGAKMRSMFCDDYFYQDLVLNFPHRSSEELVHPNDAELPNQIRNFAAALHLRPEMWRNKKKVEHFLNLQGHKDHYICTAESYVRSRVHFFNLWQRQIIGSLQVDNFATEIETSDLSPQQTRVKNLVRDFLQKRTSHYDDVPEVQSFSEDEEESAEEGEISSSSISSGINWQKYILIKGKPGTGKSHAVKVVIEDSLDKEYTVCCATPTGILTSSYRSQFVEESFYCDTIHAMFKYPVAKEDRPAVNWELGKFDVLIIDELSMVPEKIFRHIASTFQQLHVRPVVLLCGDQQQQQPIATIEGKTHQTEGIPLFQEYLNYLRYYKPSRSFLRELHNERTLCTKGEPNESQLRKLLLEHCESLVLTVSRKAAQKVNDIAVQTIFMGKTAFASVQMDNDDEQMLLYKGMRVIITQNRDKKNGVINGQNAEVLNFEQGTIILKLPNSKVVASCGQTLRKVIIWLDCPFVPRGTAYVALSRLRTLQDLYFMVYGNPEQFLPVEMLSE